MYLVKTTIFDIPFIFDNGKDGGFTSFTNALQIAKDFINEKSFNSDIEIYKKHKGNEYKVCECQFIDNQFIWFTDNLYGDEPALFDMFFDTELAA